MLEESLIETFSEFLVCREKYGAVESRFKQEVLEALEAIKDDIGHSFPEELEDVWLFGDHWGRLAVEYGLLKNPLRQWVSFGVYYDPLDHGIPFITRYRPELAVFFDMQPRNRSRLGKVAGIAAAVEELKHSGYEFNFPDVRFQNRWRVCYWRQPMTAHATGDRATLRQLFEERLSTLFNSRFYQLAANCKS
jgi:hypothetical protein